MSYRLLNYDNKEDDDFIIGLNVYLGLMSTWVAAEGILLNQANNEDCAISTSYNLKTGAFTYNNIKYELIQV